jgi:hypothetical protein
MARFLIALLGLSLSLPALAQQPPKPEPKPTAPVAAGPEASINRRQMEEDVEIMRRLLAKPVASQFAQQCATCHSNPWGATGAPSVTTDFYYQGWMNYPQDPHHSGLVPMLPVEGNYLKGYGVAFQLVLPPQKNVLKELPAAKAQAESDWENARRELHGAKVTAAKPSPESPSLADVLLKIMSDNGKNFEYLPETENFTIVVTFRGAAPVHSYGASMSGGRPRAGGGGLGSSMGGMSSSSTLKPSGGTFGSSTNSLGSGSGITGSSSGAPTGWSSGGTVADTIAAIGRDYELLGDLHTKQGKTAEAVEAYGKAVQAAKTATIAQSAGEDAKANVERVKQRIRDLSTKLAKALLDAGRVDEARKALEMETMIKVAPPGASAGSTVPLPAKLTISASKKLLDQVGSGKISYDEFRKQVTLDYSSFTEPAPMPSEPKKK